MKKPYFIIFGRVVFRSKLDAQRWWLKAYLKGRKAKDRYGSL